MVIEMEYTMRERERERERERDRVSKQHEKISITKDFVHTMFTQSTFYKSP